MKKLQLLFLTFVLLLSVSTLSAQAKKFAVSVEIGGDNEFESDVRSYVSRELRSLGDVEVVESGKFVVMIYIHATKITNGTATYNAGYAVSVSFLESIVCNKSEYLDFLSTNIISGGEDGLRKISETLVSNFDTRILENRRKLKNK